MVFYGYLTGAILYIINQIISRAGKLSNVYFISPWDGKVKLHPAIKSKRQGVILISCSKSAKENINAHSSKLE